MKNFKCTVIVCLILMFVMAFPAVSSAATQVCPIWGNVHLMHRAIDADADVLKAGTLFQMYMNNAAVWDCNCGERIITEGWFPAVLVGHYYYESELVMADRSAFAGLTYIADYAPHYATTLNPVYVFPY